MRTGVALVLLVVVTGVLACGDGDEAKTLAGAQDQNRILKEQVAGLKKDRERLRAELARVKKEATIEYDALRARSRREFDERLAAVRRLHRQEKAIFESQYADLLQEHALVRKQKLALEELRDLKPRAMEARRNQDVMGIIVCLIIIFVLVVVMGVFAMKYFSLRGVLDDRVFDKVSGTPQRQPRGMLQ